MTSAGNAERKHEEIAALAGQRGENVYTARGLCCSEAVLYVLNEAFGAGLTPAMVVRLAAGFCHGMGGGDCVCGALSGAQMGLGLLLEPKQPGGMKKKEFEQISREMHDSFQERFGATCCRVLLERGKEKKGASCKELTGGGAEIATGLLLATSPALASRIDYEFLERHETKAGLFARKLMGKS